MSEPTRPVSNGETTGTDGTAAGPVATDGIGTARDPRCPLCGSEMTPQSAAGEAFWQCSRHPECPGRRGVAGPSDVSVATSAPILRRPRLRRAPSADDVAPDRGAVMRRRPMLLAIVAVGVLLVVVLWAASALWPGERGYRVECADGWISYSGGIQGACSDHGGIRR